MAAKSGVRRKSNRRKSVIRRRLVKCGKCCYTARNHFGLRRHSTKYHRMNTPKRNLSRSVEKRRYRRSCLSSCENPNSSCVRVGNLLVMSDNNLETPSAAVRNEAKCSEDVDVKPRSVYTRKAKVAAPLVSSSGRTLRSFRCSSESCSTSVTKLNPKSRRDSLKSTSDVLNPENKSFKSKNNSLKSKSDILKLGSDGLKSKSGCLKSKIDGVKSKKCCFKSRCDSLKTKGESSKSKSADLKSKRGIGRKKDREKVRLIPLPCHLCDYIGRDTFNLRRHMQSKHEPKPPKTPKVYQCEHCEYKNRYRFLVKRHSAVHARERKGERQSGFACDRCDYVSASACNLKRHMRSRHEKVKEAKLQCSLCDHREPDRPALFGHFREAHGVIIETDRLEFEDFQSFLDFKVDTEKATLARFVRQQTRAGEKKLVIFKCHRDGIFKSKSRGERKRALKTTGSNKINSACPASMRLTIYPSGKVSVAFTKTHVGHSNEVCRLTLTREEKMLIGEMLESKRTFPEILCEIRSGMDSERLERIHLLSRKDLQNIEKWYKTRDVEEAPRITMNIDIAEWEAKVMQETGVVRLLKKPASFLQKPFKCLEYDDFVLILANDLQLAMLRHYGSECICIDNAYENAQVKLTSLVVLDDSRQGFPCAFMLSSKIDRVIMKVFLEVVRKESGCSLTPSIFVSDIPDCRRTEWSTVMNLPESTKVYYSPWSVEDDLNRNLLKVKSDTERQKVYKLVKNVISENTASELSNLMEQTTTFLDENPSTQLFGKYFKTKFVGTAHKWANCFTHRFHTEFSNSLDSIHDVLKFVYSEGQKNEKLEDCINMLMTCCRDQWSDRISLGRRIDTETHDVSEDDTAKLVSNIAERHGDAEEMKTRPADSGVYEIVEHNLQCMCGLRCIKCDVCIHSYRCTCYDSVVGWTICRHIHFCVMSNAAQETSVTLVGPPFDPLEEKRKLLLEFENICDDIAADESINESTVAEVPVVEELSHEPEPVEQDLEPPEQLPQLHELNTQQEGEEEEKNIQPIIDVTSGESKIEIPFTSVQVEQPSTVETSMQAKFEVKPPNSQQQHEHPPTQEFEDARSKLNQRFQSICQLMSSDVDLTLIEQALSSIEYAIASKRTSTQE